MKTKRLLEGLRLTENGRLSYSLPVLAIGLVQQNIWFVLAGLVSAHVSSLFLLKQPTSLSDDVSKRLEDIETKVSGLTFKAGLRN